MRAGSDMRSIRYTPNPVGSVEMDHRRQQIVVVLETRSATPGRPIPKAERPTQEIGSG